MTFHIGERPPLRPARSRKVDSVKEAARITDALYTDIRDALRFGTPADTIKAIVDDVAAREGHR